MMKEAENLLNNFWVDGKENLKEIWSEIKPYVDEIGEEMPVVILGDNIIFYGHEKINNKE